MAIAMGAAKAQGAKLRKTSDPNKMPEKVEKSSRPTLFKVLANISRNAERRGKRLRKTLGK
jgi:hypothetical protein